MQTTDDARHDQKKNGVLSRLADQPMALKIPVLSAVTVCQMNRVVNAAAKARAT